MMEMKNKGNVVIFRRFHEADRVKMYVKSMKY